MVISIYLRQFYTTLISVMESEGVPVSSIDQTASKTLQGQVFYVPEDSPEAMMEYLVRKELVTQSRISGSRFLFLGYNRGPVNKRPEQRTQRRIRLSSSNPANADVRKFVPAEFNLKTYVVSNIPEALEDFEEVYNVFIRQNTSLSVSIPEIPEFDNIDFAINTLNDEIDQYSHLTDRGNIFALGINARIIAPVMSLTSEERTRLSTITINVYNEFIDPNRLIDTIQQTV